MHSKQNPQTRIAVLVSAQREDADPEDRLGWTYRWLERTKRWATRRPPRGGRSVARRIGLAPGSVATRLVAIPETEHLNQVYGPEGIPFVTGPDPSADVLRFIQRCQSLQRRDLAAALPATRRMTLRSTAYTYGDRLYLIANTWPTPVRTCRAYQEAHEALMAYVRDGDEEAVVAFSRRWGLTIRKRQPLLSGLLAIDWDGVELFDEAQVISAINTQVRRERNWLIPINARTLNYRHIASLDGLHANTAFDPDRQDHSTSAALDSDHPCVNVLLMGLTEQEKQAVAIWAAGGRSLGWEQAALYVRAKDPASFGRRVRRLVRLNAARHEEIVRCRHCGLGIPKPGRRKKLNSNDGGTEVSQ
ncbi:hypothetical protein [Streptomyces sp. NPDC059916]|uniref:hypothetical protein n=1 Tax=Streptomyces sp. NPDC059916 TaxID=3347001 RepID=UPI003675340F